MQNSQPDQHSARHFGTAWVLLCVSLGIHVVDEAANDFLGFYNPTVLKIRETVPWLPLPTFTFGVWLGGLTLAVLVLLALSPHAYRSARGMVPVAAVLAAIMFLNGLGHVAISLYQARAAAGVYSSPLLLVVSGYLFLTIPWFKLRTGESSPGK